MSPKSKRRSYGGQGIVVSYNVKRCIHAAECVRGLPNVFDPKKRPWVQPDAAAADELVVVIERCPTGALQFERKDGGAPEVAPTENIILPVPNGPVYVHGQVEITIAGEPEQETRVALCRCGASNNKPFCDNTHLEINFEVDGNVTDNQAETGEAETGGPLKVSPTPNGPCLLQGSLEIRGADGQSIYRGSNAALCRCGGSQNKPFCDGTHTKINFIAE